MMDLFFTQDLGQDQSQGLLTTVDTEVVRRRSRAFQPMAYRKV